MLLARRTTVAAACSAVVLLGTSPAAAQWWWPPQFAPDPICPHPSSHVVVMLSGDWPDLCPPDDWQVFRIGFDIDIDARSELTGLCLLPQITPWSLPVHIGQLPEGTYSVYARHLLDGQPTTGRTFVGSFIVDVECCPACPMPCYANCDGSTVEPILNVDDFTCFINRFAEAQLLPHEQQIGHYANCDESTTAPVLNVDDFTCFINAFAAGCP